MTMFHTVDEVDVSVEHARIYEEGWQSWSPTRWYRLTEAPRRPEMSWQHTMRFRPGTPLPAQGFQGEGLLVIDPGTGAHARAYVAQHISEQVPTIRAERAGSRLVVSADAPVTTRMVPGHGAVALSHIGDELALRSEVSEVRAAPTVWCSWYHYFEDVRSDDILENLDAVTRLGLPVDVVQIDDGWQAGIGDWHLLSERFSSVADVASRIRQAGMRAGIWLAPFTVGRQSTLARDHPDWLVGDADAGHNWGQDLAGLDLTHPDARAYLASVFGALREAGFDYFKLDFLYAGAVPGRRHRDTTGVESYRSGLKLIRDVVGPDSYLLGCGAPIFPSVGVVDGMRIAPDTFHAQNSHHTEELRGAEAARSRAWQHGRFWVNDADCLVARPDYVRRADLVTMVEQFSGLRSFSDRIADLDPWGIETVRRLLTSAPPPTPLATTALPAPAEF